MHKISVIDREMVFRFSQEMSIYLKKLSILSALVFLIICLAISLADLHAQSLATESEQILEVAEYTFKAMKDRRYSDIWNSLTSKTQDSIVKDVILASAKNGQNLDKDNTIEDFAAGGILSKAYWDGYLAYFNPDMVLQQCTWKIEANDIKQEEAQIILQYKKAEKPAILKLRKEEGTGKQDWVKHLV